MCGEEGSLGSGYRRVIEEVQAGNTTASQKDTRCLSERHLCYTLPEGKSD